MAKETHFERSERIYSNPHNIVKASQGKYDLELAKLAVTSHHAFQQVVRQALDSYPYDLGKALSFPPLVQELQRYLGLLSYAGIGEIQGLPLSEQVFTYITQLWQQECHRKAGKKVYEISPALAERLFHTELRGLTTDHLKLPFKNIYILIPGNTNIRIPHPETGEHRLEGMYITEGKDEWIILAVGESSPSSPSGELDDALFRFGLPLPTGTKLNELDLPSHQLLQDLFRFAMNVVVYATKLPNAQIEEIIANREARKLMERIRKLPRGTKKKRLQERLKSVPKQHRIYLGRDTPRMQEAGTQGQGTPLTKRVLVSGHWRNQPYGEGRTKRKLIWIKPFWRGPEEGKESNPRRIIK